MGAHQFENFEIHMRLDYQGIGALLGERDAEVVVERILPGGPSEKYGKLKSGDQIVSVGQGEDGPMKDVIGMRLRDVVKLIRGESGTVVRVGVVPADGGDVVVHNLTRGRTGLVEEAATSRVIQRDGV